jgi:hypothetical protein
LSTQQILQTLQNYSSLFHLDTIVMRTLREIGWDLIRALVYIVDMLSSVANALYKLNIFYDNAQVVSFINSFKPVIIALFAISLCVTGYEVMLAQNKQFRKVAINITVAIAIIIILPAGMDQLNNITNAGVSATNSSSTDTSNTIIKENITDLLLYDKLNFNSDSINQLKSNNNILEANIRYIDPDELVEPDLFNSMDIQNEDVFKNELVLGEDGTPTIQSLNQSWYTISILKEYYYRYSINFINIIVALIAVAIALAFTLFKLGRIIFELGYNKFLAIMVAPTDIGSGQRTKQIINNIISMYVVTFLIAVLLKMYVLFIGIASGVQSAVQIVLMVAGSYALIDGPNVVERLFGIDAGLQSGFKTIMAAYGTGKAIAGVASTVGKTAKNAVDWVKDNNSNGNLYNEMDKKDNADQNDSVAKKDNNSIYDKMDNTSQNDSQDQNNNDNNGQDNSMYSDTNGASQDNDTNESSASNSIYDQMNNSEQELNNTENGDTGNEDSNSINSPKNNVDNGIGNKDTSGKNIENTSGDIKDNGSLYEQMSNGNNSSDGAAIKSSTKSGNTENHLKGDNLLNSNGGIYEDMKKNTTGEQVSSLGTGDSNINNPGDMSNGIGSSNINDSGSISSDIGDSSINNSAAKSSGDNIDYSESISSGTGDGNINNSGSISSNIGDSSINDSVDISSSTGDSNINNPGDMSNSIGSNNINSFGSISSTIGDNKLSNSGQSPNFSGDNNMGQQINSSNSENRETINNDFKDKIEGIKSYEPDKKVNNISKSTLGQLNNKNN